MDEIISLRTFGRKNNWFFDGKLTVGSLRAVLVAVGAVAALTLVLLTAYTLRVLQPLDAEFTRLADLDTAISTLAAQRWPVEAKEQTFVLREIRRCLGRALRA